MLFIFSVLYAFKYGQHTLYLCGLHGMGDAAPTRIAFFSVPELADF
jgi:hypothetical protein